MMNNIMQMMQMIKNPQVLMQQALQNPQIMQNPVAKNAIDMYQRGDTKGLEEIARNVCKEKGIKPEDAINQVKQKFGGLL